VTEIRTTPSGRWFMRVVWIGIAVNLALAAGVIAAPAFMLQ
jgi:hypothetical protein